MRVSFDFAASRKTTPLALVSVGSRLVVVVAVVCATAASVWLGDTVSSSLPPTFAKAPAAPAPRVAAALPTVVIVGRRDSMHEAPATTSQNESAEVSSLDPANVAPGRAKFRQ